MRVHEDVGAHRKCGEASPGLNFEFRGGVFQSDWTVTLQETNGLESLAMLDPDGGGRKFSLCLGTPEEKTLLLGALPRAAGSGETRAKPQGKRR